MQTSSRLVFQKLFEVLHQQSSGRNLEAPLLWWCTMFVPDLVVERAPGRIPQTVYQPVKRIAAQF